jgi:hypothetical protein
MCFQAHDLVLSASSLECEDVGALVEQRPAQLDETWEWRQGTADDDIRAEVKIFCTGSNDPGRQTAGLDR